MSRPARIVIDRDALRHNFRRIRQIAPRARIMAVIKADAYGHGLVRVAATLGDADAFGVACLEEAEQLRQAGVTKPVVLLEGPHQTHDLDRIAALGLDIVLHNEAQLAALERAGPAQPLPVWLKLDTGMHRLGFASGQAADIAGRVLACKHIRRPVRLMTHLATASEPDHPQTRRQLALFAELCLDFDAERSIANSAALLTDPATHCDWVRPGIMLYGVSPLAGGTAAAHDLRPVMTLESELIAVRRLAKGEPVGYGAAWRCPEAMPIGVIALGYGDGYPRHAPSGTPALVNDVRCALIGLASMDMLTVDLRPQPEARIGDRVVLWGAGLPVEEIARHAGTIPYELLCGVHGRLARVERGQA